MSIDLSVIIICYNEENDIERAISSVSFAKEIIIVDSGSSDATLQIARKYTDKIYHNDWQGFGIQKNYSLSKATCSWVLSLDADEWVTPELALEIQRVVAANEDVAYKIPRKSYFCGKLIKYGHWRSDSVLRLFKREHGKFTNDLVHEKLCVTSPVKKLKNYFLHNSFSSYEDVLLKMNSYSSLLADQKYGNKKSTSLFSGALRAIWSFINSYFLRLGFLDGKEGFMVAFSFAEGTLYKYIKLDYLNNPKDPLKRS